MTAAYAVSRKLQQAARDQWLIANRARVAARPADVIASEMRSAGLYSAKTSLVDVRSGIHRRCKALRLPFSNLTNA